MHSKFSYRLATKEDAPQILDFMIQYFYPEEPCSRALGLSSSQVRPLYADLISRCLNFPFSIMVTLESGELVGILLNSIWRRSDEEGDGADYDTEAEQKCEKYDAFIKLLNDTHNGFWELAPSGVDVVLHGEIACVAGPYQRRGIGTKLYSAGMMDKKMLDEFKVDGVISETSSFSNQNLLKKLGFKCLKEIPYSNVVDSQGNQIMKVDDGAVGIRLNFKKVVDYDFDLNLNLDH